MKAKKIDTPRNTRSNWLVNRFVAAALAVTTFSATAEAATIPHYVGLSWTPSTSEPTDADGDPCCTNVLFEGPSGGPYTALNASSPASDAGYIDTNITLGTTRCYEIEAKDTAGNISAPSSPQTCVTIPSVFPPATSTLSQSGTTVQIQLLDGLGNVIATPTITLPSGYNAKKHTVNPDGTSFLFSMNPTTGAVVIDTLNSVGTVTITQSFNAVSGWIIQDYVQNVANGMSYMSFLPTGANPVQFALSAWTTNNSTVISSTNPVGTGTTVQGYALPVWTQAQGTANGIPLPAGGGTWLYAGLTANNYASTATTQPVEVLFYLPTSASNTAVGGWRINSNLTQGTAYEWKYPSSVNGGVISVLLNGWLPKTLAVNPVDGTQELLVTCTVASSTCPSGGQAALFKSDQNWNMVNYPNSTLPYVIYGPESGFAAQTISYSSNGGLFMEWAATSGSVQVTWFFDNATRPAGGPSGNVPNGAGGIGSPYYLAYAVLGTPIAETRPAPSRLRQLFVAVAKHVLGYEPHPKSSEASDAMASARVFDRPSRLSATATPLLNPHSAAPDNTPRPPSTGQIMIASNGSGKIAPPRILAIQ